VSFCLSLSFSPSVPLRPPAPPNVLIVPRVTSGIDRHTGPPKKTCQPLSERGYNSSTPVHLPGRPADRPPIYTARWRQNLVISGRPAGVSGLNRKRKKKYRAIKRPAHAHACDRVEQSALNPIVAGRGVLRAPSLTGDGPFPIGKFRFRASTMFRYILQLILSYMNSGSCCVVQRTLALTFLYCSATTEKRIAKVPQI